MVITVKVSISRYRLKSKLWETYLRFFVQPPDQVNSIPGYLHPLEARFLFWLATRVHDGGYALEVGSFQGKSSFALAAGLSSRARLGCVDTWFNDAMPYDAAGDTLPSFLHNIRRYTGVIDIHRGKSVDIASQWSRPLDLLFIDGDHSYEGCKSDIQAWGGFVRPGGWIAFHDSSEPGVDGAISEFFPKFKRRTELTAWSIFAAVKNCD